VILKLELPALEWGVRTGAVARWHKLPGDRIEYGDVICDVAGRQSEAVARTKDAFHLADPSSYRPVKPGRRVVRMQVRFQLLAAEPGFLREVQAQEGDLVQVGGLLALVSTEGSEPVAPATSTMRVAARLEEKTEELR
jgi:pyruvate/2-oxoglutarate dehydrogenase complex dihydrolipoamide acyltransferase (E2) component